MTVSHTNVALTCVYTDAPPITQIKPTNMKLFDLKHEYFESMF